MGREDEGEGRAKKGFVYCFFSLFSFASYYVVILSFFYLLSSFAIGIIVDPSVFSSVFALFPQFQLMLTHWTIAQGTK
jgi:hypothetical protein